MTQRISLGDVLVDEQLLSPQQLKQAQRAAERSGAALISVILEQRLVDEEALVTALCRRLELEVFDPDRTVVEVDAVREVPLEEANRYRLLPVQLERRAGRRILRVAMADPLDAHAIEEIEFSTGCAVEPMIARPSQVGEAVRSHYRSVVTKVIPRGREATPGAAPTPPAPTRRQSFGGRPGQVDVRTQPLRRIQQDAPPAARVDALVALLVRKGLIAQDEYEEQLRSMVARTEES
ncbi:MAG: hypothetical protein IT371_04230 [Deltaproteobacteria bacterium]|nr:hypothetical protein [Deltaproteobacteria bacterium]